MKPLTFFLEMLKTLRTELLEKFVLPEVGVSYWKYVIGLAIAAVVITVLVNVVRIGTVNYSFSSEFNRNTKHNEGGNASQFRSMSQRNPSGSVSSSGRSGGYRSKPPHMKTPIYDRQGRRVQ